MNVGSWPLEDKAGATMLGARLAHVVFDGDLNKFLSVRRASIK